MTNHLSYHHTEDQINDDNEEYYFRPAFTISNNTKIIKNRDKQYDCKFFIDINSK